MPQLSAGQSTTISLASADALIVSCATGASVASVAASTGFIGSPYALGTVVGESKRTFGPYGRAVTLIVTCSVGSVSAESDADAASPPDFLVSGAGKTLTASVNQGPTLLVISDSLLKSFLPPNNFSNFNPTTAKGSYYSATPTRTAGVQAIHSENPVRMTIRASDRFASGDEVMFDELPSNHPLGMRRYTIDVLSATEITIPGVDASTWTPFASAGASTDAMAHVDMVWGDVGGLTYLQDALGYPFSRIDAIIRPGATVAQLNEAVASTTLPLAQYDFVLYLAGRNTTTYSAAEMEVARDQVLARGAWAVVCTPPPDATWAGYTAASQTKLKAMSKFWWQQQPNYSQLRICDLFSVFSDSTAQYEAARPGLHSSDSVHWNPTGACLAGNAIADVWPAVTVPNRAIARIGEGGDNLLTGGRFTGGGGTVGGGVTALVAAASIATGWTIGRKSNSGTCLAQLWELPAIERRSGVAYAANKVLDVGDGWWYVVKTGGSAAAAYPESAYQGVLSGSATYDAASLAAGASVSTNVTVTGAALGDAVIGASFSLDTQGITLSATVSSANTVRVTLTNPTAGAIDLASGTLTAQVRRMTGAMLFDTTVGVTDGTLNLYRIPKFTDSLEAMLYQGLGVGATADGGRESMSFFQTISLPGGVAVGDHLQGAMNWVQLSGFCKDPQLSLILKDAGNTQLAYAGVCVPNVLQSQTPGRAKPQRVKQRKTRKLRVPPTATQAELEFKPFIPVGIAWFAVAVASIEEVSAPGWID